MAKQTPAVIGTRPTNLDEHNADMARRASEHEAKRRRLLDCLDPTVAKYHEDRKELWEWLVEVKLFRPAVGKAHAHMQDFSEKVVAQHEADAWSMFCDKVGEWPSRRDSEPKISKLKKRSLRDTEV